jgi:hypothetical protein
MANKQRGEVGFELDGVNYTLRFSTNAMCELEDATGVPVLQLANSLQDERSVSIKTLRAMFAAGLSDTSDISIKEAGDIIDGLGIPRAGELIGQAFMAAFPEADSDAVGKPKAK